MKTTTTTTIINTVIINFLQLLIYHQTTTFGIPTPFIHMDCGIKSLDKTFGFSVMDDNLYQFLDCQLIIYSDFRNRFDMDKNQLTLFDGNRFQFNVLQSSLNKSYCLPSSTIENFGSKKLYFSYSILRLNQNGHDFRTNSTLLYFVKKLNKTTIEILVHNLDQQKDLLVLRNHPNLPNIHYILVNKQYIIYNDATQHQYPLIKDLLLDNDPIDNHQPIGYFCISYNNTINDFVIRLGKNKCKSYSYTDKIFHNIHTSFTSPYHDKFFLISYERKEVLIIDRKILRKDYIEHEFRLIIKSFDDFFVCKPLTSSSGSNTNRLTKREAIFNEKLMANNQGNQMGNSKKVGKFSISTFVIVIIVNVIIAMILILYFRTTSYFDDIID